MDAKESDRQLKKKLAVETVRPPSVPAERSNGVAAQRAKVREVNSRYMSASMSTPTAAKRCPSPISRSTATLPSAVVPKRPVSTERKRPLSPFSPSRLSTPVRDIDVSLSARKIALTKQPESLWPSTMRNLSFISESDGYANPAPKKENYVTHPLSDISLRLSSNASHKQPELCPFSRKETPERKRSPPKGKSLLDQEESTKPAESSLSTLADQHRWPSRIRGKVSTISLNRSVNFTDMIIRNSPSLQPRNPMPSSRRLSGEMSNPIQKISSDVTAQKSSDRSILERKEPRGDSSSNTNMLKSPKLRKPPSGSSSDIIAVSTPLCRSRSLPSPRHPSPIRSASQSKVSSTSYSRPATPKGLSPSRIRPLSMFKQPSSSSVLSFVADFRKPKKSNQLEDAHQLRLLHNRHLQWRFANAGTDVALRSQKITAEIGLYNVWRTNLNLWDLVIVKKIRLQQMRLELKLSIILNDQMRYLDEWASLEKEHTLSLDGIIKKLEARTLRLPLTEGSSADIRSLKVVINSAMDVMQSMGRPVVTLLSRACEVNKLVSHLADLAVQERAMLDECQALLALNATIQVEESSLRTHLIQNIHTLITRNHTTQHP